MGFEQEVRTKGFDEPPPLFWFYVSFVGEDDGGFMGAALVEAPGWNKSFSVAGKRMLMPAGAKFGHYVEIPKDKLPAAEYRNRILSRGEIEALWPGVRIDKTARGSK